MYIKSIVVPKAWVEVFNQVKAQYPDALMAGGCLRDLEMSRPVKDIDIFVCKPKPKGEFELSEYSGGISDPVKLEGYTEDRDQAFDSSDCPDNTLRGTTVFVSKDGLPVNIIYLKDGVTPKERFDRFDFGFNKIGYDGEKVFSHPDYGFDTTTRMMTLRRVDNHEQLKKSLQRAQKFQEKYHSWPLVIPAEHIAKFNELLGIHQKPPEAIVSSGDASTDFPF